MFQHQAGAIKTPHRDAGPHSEPGLHPARTPPATEQTSKGTKKSETLRREGRSRPDLTAAQLSRRGSRPGTPGEAPGARWALGVRTQRAPEPAGTGVRAAGAPQLAKAPPPDMRGPRRLARGHTGCQRAAPRLRAQRGLAPGPSPRGPRRPGGGRARAPRPLRGRAAPNARLAGRCPLAHLLRVRGRSQARLQLLHDLERRLRRHRCHWRGLLAGTGLESRPRAAAPPSVHPPRRRKRYWPLPGLRGVGVRGTRGARPGPAAGTTPRVRDPVPSGRATAARTESRGRRVPARWPRSALATLGSPAFGPRCGEPEPGRPPRYLVTTE